MLPALSVLEAVLAGETVGNRDADSGSKAMSDSGSTLEVTPAPPLRGSSTTGDFAFSLLPLAGFAGVGSKDYVSK